MPYHMSRRERTVPKDQRRRQKSLERKAAKRKQKKHVITRQATPTTFRASLRAAAKWPLLECLATKNWQNPGELIQIIVARESPDGEVAVGVFLVDLGCLGVKNAYAKLLSYRDEYQDLVREPTTARQPMAPMHLNLAAKIVREGIEYARSLGFTPNRDYPDAAILLGDADPDAVRTPIPLGKDGKPFFVNGPYDNVPKIMNQLERAVGPGNFEFIAALGGPLDFLDDDEAEYIIDAEDIEDEEPPPPSPRFSLPWRRQR